MFSVINFILQFCYKDANEKVHNFSLNISTYINNNLSYNEATRCHSSIRKMTPHTGYIMLQCLSSESNLDHIYTIINNIFLFLLLDWPLLVACRGGGGPRVRYLGGMVGKREREVRFPRWQEQRQILICSTA